MARKAPFYAGEMQSSQPSTVLLRVLPRAGVKFLWLAILIWIGAAAGLLVQAALRPQMETPSLLGSLLCLGIAAIYARTVVMIGWGRYEVVREPENTWTFFAGVGSIGRRFRVRDSEIEDITVANRAFGRYLYPVVVIRKSKGEVKFGRHLEPDQQQELVAWIQSGLGR